jgi:beta-D-xylosidase 4
MYPASYAGQVSMLEMSMRPSRANPGRTYQWYTGTPAYTFGYGLSYTNFSAKLALNEKLTTFNTTDLADLCKNEKFLDLCPFSTLKVDITNEGSKFTSDYSALAFISGEYGPFPRPKKMLVAYTRLHEVAPGETQSADLKLTLSSLSRVNEKGQRILYPGKFRVAIDTDPELAETTFELVGPEVLLDEYPVDPKSKGGEKWTGGPPSFDPPQQEVMGSMDL